MLRVKMQMETVMEAMMAEIEWNGIFDDIEVEKFGNATYIKAKYDRFYHLNHY